VDAPYRRALTKSQYGTLTRCSGLVGPAAGAFRDER
jgi:hypothetical protein